SRIDGELAVQLFRAAAIAGEQVGSRHAGESSPPPPLSRSAPVPLLGGCKRSRTGDVPPVDPLLAHQVQEIRDAIGIEPASGDSVEKAVFPKRLCAPVGE